MKTLSREPQFRYVNQMVGVFVLLTVFIFVLAVLGSGRFQQWLNPGARIKVILPESGLFGLTEGAAVEILGTSAGKVVDIVIDPDQKIHAEIEIPNDMKTFVRQDSKAIIRKRFGVAGAAYLEITRGYGEPLDWHYAVLEAEADRAPTETVSSLIKEVRGKIFPVIDDTQAAVQIFQAVGQSLLKPNSDWQQLLAGLNTIAARIARGEGVFGRLLTREELANELEIMISDVNHITRRLIPMLDDLAVTASHMSGLSGQLSERARDLPQVTQALQDLLLAANKVLKDLSHVTPQLPQLTGNVNEASTHLPVLLVQTQQVMVELDQLLSQLRSHWLLGGKASEARQSSSRISPREVNP